MITHMQARGIRGNGRQLYSLSITPKETSRSLFFIKKSDQVASWMSKKHSEFTSQGLNLVSLADFAGCANSNNHPPSEKKLAKRSLMCWSLVCAMEWGALSSSSCPLIPPSFDLGCTLHGPASHQLQQGLPSLLPEQQPPLHGDAFM